jgi:hypothetical protein
MRQAVGIGFNAELFATPAQADDHIFQLRRRFGAGHVGPNANVLDDRCVLRLAQIGGASEKRQPAVGSEIQALKEAKAEGVVTGQVIHALLMEHEQSVKPALLKGFDDLGRAVLVFTAFEVQCHAGSSF